MNTNHRLGILFCAIVSLFLGLLASCQMASNPSQPAVLEKAGTPIPCSSIPGPIPTGEPPATPTPWPPSPFAADLTFHTSLNQAHHLAFSADGRYLWASTQHGLVRWNLENDRPLSFTVTEALPGGFLTDLAVTPSSSNGAGRLWAASPAGLVSIDGSQVHTYTQEDGLPDGGPERLAVDDTGGLWATYPGDLVHFDGHDFQIFTTAEGLPDGVIKELYPTSDGALWLETACAIVRYDPAAVTSQSYDETNGLPQSGGRLLGVDTENMPWVYFAYDHVYRFDGVDWSPVYLAGDSQIVCDLTFDGAGSPWLATCDGWHAYGAGLANRLGEGTPSGIPGNEGWFLAGVENGNQVGQKKQILLQVETGPGDLLAAATSQGIVLRQNGRWRDLLSGPPMDNPVSLAVTLDGVVWTGYGQESPTQGALSGRYDPASGSWMAVQPAGATLFTVAPVGVPGAGRLWSARGCEVAYHDGTDWQPTSDCGTLLGQVGRLAFALDGSIWAATGLATGHYDPVTAAWTIYDHLAVDVAVAPDGDVWLSAWTGRQGDYYLATLTPPEETFMTLAANRPIGSRLAFSGDGVLWLTAETGLERYFDGEWTAVTAIDTAGGPSTLGRVTALVSTAEGNLWLGTEDGLLAYYEPNSANEMSWTAYPLGIGLSGPLSPAPMVRFGLPPPRGSPTLPDPTAHEFMDLSSHSPCSPIFTRIRNPNIKTFGTLKVGLIL